MLNRRMWILMSTVFVLAFILSLGEDARAAYVINVTQSGGNLVFSGSGSIDTTDLADVESVYYGGPYIDADTDHALFGSVGTGGIYADYFQGISGPSRFGSSFFTIMPDSGTGDAFGLYGSDIVAVPTGYVSGSMLGFSDIAVGQTISGDGLTLGTYVWTWGSGADADSLTINIGVSSVPEPASLVMVGTGSLAIFGHARRRRRRPA